MKKEEITTALSKVSFEDNLIQVLSLRPEGTEIAFPLTEGPINFSVISSTGLSVRWGVKIGPKGDTYIYNRDVKNAEKVSLHASGDQHIAITDKRAVQIDPHKRIGLRWTEPVFNQRAVPTFSILFPTWGVTDRCPENLIKGRGELLIVGHVEKVVVVGFFIVDSSRKLQVNARHFMLGKLVLRPGKVLYVAAWKEPENGLKALLRASLKQVEDFLPKDDDLVIDFQGFQAPNSAFMVAVPAVALR